MLKQPKIFLLILCSFFYLQNINAQVDTVKALQLKNRLVDSICVIFNSTDTSAIKTIQDVQAILSIGITKYSELLTNYAEAAGNDMSTVSDEKLQQIADAIALEVYNKCPAMKIMIDHVKSKRD